MGLSKKYRKSLTKQWSMRFKTRHPDGDCYDGIVTHIKPKFVVLREEIDFEFDGVQILSKNLIKGWRDSKYDRCSNEIIRANGAIEKAHAPAWLDDCQTWRDIISQLHQRKIWPAVETQDNAAGKFYLGPIEQVCAKHFWLRSYDNAGRWNFNYQLKYKEIYRIMFDDRYCNHFNAYMLKSWQPEG